MEKKNKNLPFKSYIYKKRVRLRSYLHALRQLHLFDFFNGKKIKYTDSKISKLYYYIIMADLRYSSSSLYVYENLIARSQCPQCPQCPQYLNWSSRAKIAKNRRIR